MELKINSKKYGEFVVLIDDEDYDKIKNYTWGIHNTIYYFHAITTIRDKETGKLKKLTLHRLITDCPDGLMVDHINHNTLDNRKCNLRICTNAENQRNQLPQNKSSSKYKGVSRKKDYKYEVMIKINGKKIYLGRFINEKDAALTYNKAALKYFGEFACLNEITL